MKKFLALALAFIMVFALATTAFAQTATPATSDTDGASITISNASKGETYSVYKLFDADIQGGVDGPIYYYTTAIPAELSTYFTGNNDNTSDPALIVNITATDAAKAADGSASEALRTALEAWVGTADAIATAKSDGTTLTFSGLPYGYYVITTTQGKQTITVDSTNPNASIVDKNTTVISTPVKSDDVDDNGAFFGDTVTYTVEFTTANYYTPETADAKAEQVVSYTITDTLPGFLSNVNVTSIKIDETPTDDTDEAIDVTEQFDDNGKITIDWVKTESDNSKTSLYKNGAKVIITYTATVNSSATIAGNGNTNNVTLTWDTTVNTGYGELKNSTVFSTYAIALKKINDEGQPLAGATFQFPFYVEAKDATVTDDGVYIYAGITPGEGLTNEITTSASGEIVIKGVAAGNYTVKETNAPDGYNKLVGDITVPAEKMSTTETTVTKYLNADGKVVDEVTETAITYTNKDLAASVTFVVNKAGVELPSTGGMGTTVFYVIGAVLMLGAVVVLVSRKRMAA